MRFPIVALAATLLAAGPVYAQTTPAPAASAPAAATPAPATTAAPAAKPATKHVQRRVTAAQRFAAANTTHDGHLTKDQAKAGHLTAIYNHFDAMDKDQKGYVTQDDIKAYYAAQRHARRAAKPAAKPAPTTAAPAATTAAPAATTTAPAAAPAKN